jgi:CBS domain-containing protein
MKQWTVSDVMTADVKSVREDTPYRAIVDALTGRHISAVPVVDGFEHVVGVVSEADLLHKIEFIGDEHERRVFERRSRREARAKADAAVAKDLMSAPAVTVLSSTPIVTAARLMDSERVKRLPVVDELGRLVGIVARADLLKMHLRLDPEIRADIIEGVLRQTLWLDPLPVDVDVAGGVVTLRGKVDRKSTVPVVLRLIEAVPGVVQVVNELGWDYDDATESTFYRSHPFSSTTHQPQ